MLRETGLTAILLAFGAAELRANDFRDPIFAAPIRNTPGTYVPRGSTLNAPVITPVGSKHGNTIFDVTPMGTDADSILTKHPEHYLTSQFECTAWFTLDFLYWATQGPNATPLVTTGPPLLGPGFDAAITVPTTQTLFGGERILTGLRPGVRFTGGFFLDSAKDWAIGYSGTFLGSQSERLDGTADGSSIVNLPQFNTVLGVSVQTPVYVGYPGLTRGTFTASVQSSFAAAEAQLRRVAQSGTGYRFDLIGGYRYMQLGDATATSFDIVSATLPGNFSPRLMGEQSVRTRNMFNGGEAGFQFQGRMGKWTFGWQSTIALGSTSTEIDRSFTRSLFGGTLIPGSLPIQTGGLEKATEFAVVPQVGLKLGWEPIPHIRLTAGYDFVYWSRVRRASELFIGNDVVTDFWAQGMSAGFEFRF